MASSEVGEGEEGEAAAGFCFPRAWWRRARRKAETAARARETGNQERVWRRMSGPFTGCREIARHAIAAGGGEADLGLGLGFGSERER